MSDVEEWRPVVGYEGFYEVSSLGRVKSLRREVPVPASARSRAYSKMVRERILALPPPGPNGYVAIGLDRDGMRAGYSVHVLVCAAFHGPRPSGHDVAHADGCRSNNSAANLRYATRRDNLEDRLRHGTDVRGERNPGSTLTEADVIEIKSLLNTETHAEIAERYGVTRACITNINIGKSWKHVPG